MNEEEKQAIETMKHWIEYEKSNKDKINKADELIEIQETVLNLLENKDKQIEQYQNILATNDMLHVLECEKKDKIINEQIDYIYSFLHGHLDYISNDIAGNKKKLKQYFERKVENGN